MGEREGNDEGNERTRRREGRIGGGEDWRKHNWRRRERQKGGGKGGKQEKVQG